MLFENFIAAVTILACVACAATRKHGDIWAQVAAKDYIWLHGPTIASVCVEAHNP